MLLRQISSKKPLNIAIIGAGIAGLTAAVSHARTGANIHIFERADALAEMGASIQLSPNATRILFKLGLEDALREKWVEPHSVKLTDARSLRVITEVPVAKMAKHWWGAPYSTMRRADLQNLLYQAVLKQDYCRIHFSSHLDFNSPDRLITDLTARMGVRPSLIIGADGTYSAVREIISSTGHLTFTKYDAWRFILDINSRVYLPVEMNESNSVHILMGTANHAAIYPTDHNGNTNMVLIARNKHKTNETIDLDQTLSSHTFNKNTTKLLKSAEPLGRWPINQVTDGAWTNGHNIILIGDAAHAIMPFMAQGAAMAIEDAYVLSLMVENSLDNLGETLYHFEQKRKSRISRIRIRTAFNRFSYHAAGPIKWGRDLILSYVSSSTLGRNLDWLYGWQPDE